MMRDIKKTVKGFGITNNIEDISLAVMFICLIAFRDKTILRNATQIINILIQFLHRVRGGRLRAQKCLLIYLLWGVSFAIYGLLSYEWAITRVTVLSCFISIVQVVLVGASIILYVDGKPQQYEKALGMLTLAGLVLCVRILIAVPKSAWGSERIASFIHYSNVTITYSLSYIGVLAFAKGLREKDKYYIIYSLIIVLFSLLSGSKKALFIMGVSVAVLLILDSRKLNKIIKNTMLFIIIIGAFLVAITTIPALKNSLWVRLVSMWGQLNGTMLDKSTRDRLLLIRYALDTFKSSPIHGIGLDAFRYNNPVGRYAHNNFMEMLSCLGIIGFVLYYWIFMKYLLETGKAAFKRGNRVCLDFFVAILCILIMDYASVSYSLEPVQVIFAMSIAGFYAFNKMSEAASIYRQGKDR